MIKIEVKNSNQFIHLKKYNKQMQSTEILHLTLAEYSPQHQHYIVSDYLLSKLNANHIYSKQVDHQKTNKQLNEKNEKKVKTKKIKFIFPEEMLYLTYIAQYQQYASITPKTTRQQWEKLRQEDILKIYSLLTEKGYNKFQFLQFYLKIRKKSKLIERYQDEELQKLKIKASLYRIYKTIQNFKQKDKEETFYLVDKIEKLSNILAVRKHYIQNSPIKIQILSNLDGMIVISKPSFMIIDKAMENDSK